MEASQGLAEVETLSPQLAESYLRYVWVSGRVELAVPGLGLRWSGSHLPLGSAVALTRFLFRGARPAKSLVSQITLEYELFKSLNFN
jgi:hypothetical protein